MNEIGILQRRLMRRFRVWARRNELSRKLAFSLAGAAVVLGLATVATLTGSSPIVAEARTVLYLLVLDAVVLLMLGIVIARRLYRVWQAHRGGRAGSRLHTRIIMMFSLVALTPAILVAAFSWTFLNYGFQSWFNERVNTALGASRAVAQAYLHEHRQNIRGDALAMANDLNREAPELARNPRLFSRVLSNQAGVRGLPEVLVMDGAGRVIARSALSLSLSVDLVERPIFEQARQGKVIVLTGSEDDRVRAIIRLNRFVDAYLLVGRFVDPKALEHIERTNRAVTQYNRLKERRAGIQVTFVMIYVVVSMLLLLAAGWVGLTLANQLVRPISGLIEAAERVRDGDLTARVEVAATNDETSSLGRAFNRMTSQLETQQKGLITANRELDERRRFTETVLTGVSAGVIGLDRGGRIHLPNRSASDLLATNLETAIGNHLRDVVPEMAKLLEDVNRRPERLTQDEITVVRGRGTRTFLVRMATEQLEGSIIGYVVTFDDITELQSAQRKAAWADIARRIAHEIKNPLTPIQLSAERLKRKYLKEVQTDPDVFAACTDTIIRHVGDIGRMVDEFSAFARMPQPEMKDENLSEICRQAVFLEQNRNPDVEFALDLPADDARLLCDSRQVGRALTNVLKNAAESMVGRTVDEDSKSPIVRLIVRDESPAGDAPTMVVVEDNGRGLPKAERGRLTEPYVTTREKGTGLGLAIVKKIMEDHGGDLALDDRDEGGARVSLVFGLVDRESIADSTENDEPDSMTLAAGTMLHDA